MADTRIVARLDDRLISDGVLPKQFKGDYSTVHSMLNSYMRRYGGKLSDENFKKGEKKLRDWLMILHKKGASQEKLTAYLRTGLAHLSFDYIDSQNPGLTGEDIVYRALQSFKQRNFHRSYFKVAPTKEEKRISIKKK
ncbi:MAG: hypothetical protein ACMUIE_00070 [Thermoplasmatota archaeon]